jgi:hypothetical protein
VRVITGKKNKQAKIIWHGFVPDTDPRYSGGWNFISGKNLNEARQCAARPSRMAERTTAEILAEARHIRDSVVEFFALYGPHRAAGRERGLAGGEARAVALSHRAEVQGYSTLTDGLKRDRGHGCAAAHDRLTGVDTALHGCAAAGGATPPPTGYPWAEGGWSAGRGRGHVSCSPNLEHRV